MIISVDTEYSDLDLKKASLLSISIGLGSDKSKIFRHDFVSAKEIIDNASIILFWNASVDLHMLSTINIHVPKNKVFDSMLAEHLIDERLAHSLGDFAEREYQDDYKMQFWGLYNRFQDAPEEVADIYEHKDAIYTYRAGIKYMDLLKDRMHLVEHVQNLQWSLFDTEIRGIKVNEQLIRDTKESMGNEINLYLGRLREEYGEYASSWELEEWAKEIDKRKTEKGKAGVKKPKFSFASDKQIRWLVYDALQCPVIEKTKKGSPKTDYDTLSTLGQSFPELKTLIDYKETKAVYSTFVEGMLDRVDQGRIYPGFYINGTATGRISHNNPNMANLPREGIIRNFFIPDIGYSIVGADYSQLEVVVEANLTDDKQLLKIILEGASKHDITANGLGISRDQAKTLNFALQYGAGVRKISKILGISHNDAEDVFNRYWNLYSGCKLLKQETIKELETFGFVTNIFGRQRHFDRPGNEFEKARQERQAVNFKVQGVGADITNAATYKVANYLKYNEIGMLLFSVHDEIVCQAKQELTEQAKTHIIRLMEEVNEMVNFKYHVHAKPYGGVPCWGKL